MKQKNSLTGFFAIMFVFNMAANFVHPVTPTIILDLNLNDYMFGLALAAQMLCNFIFSPFWGKMAGYLSMTLIASFLLRWLEKKLDGDSSYELVQADPLTMTAGTYNHPERGTPFNGENKERRDREVQKLRFGRNRGER